jgi:hypothetical protein
MVVLCTFVTTSLADVRADLANCGCESRSTTHESHCLSANVRTVSIETDAFHQLCHILLLQAGLSAVFACLNALDTDLDAGLVFLVSHAVFLLWLIDPGESKTIQSPKASRKTDRARAAVE